MSQHNEKPLISICVPCFNHEKYIPFFMESILSQDYDNWELIITDDCSTDNSYKLLKSYEDSRIKIFQNDRNRHLCDTMNNSFSHAQGKYICVMYTDDAMRAHKIKQDVDFMETHPEIGVLYTNTIHIGEDNQIIEPQYQLPDLSNKNIILRDLYLHTNVLSIPGMVMRKTCLDSVGYHHRLLRLTQDYEHHVRLLFHTEIALSQQPTVWYRIREGEANLSFMSPENINALYTEIPFVLENYHKEIKTVEKLLNIFPEAKNFGEPKEDFIPYFLGRIALTSDINSVRFYGLNLIYQFMMSENNIEKLEQEYNFLPKDFMNLAKTSDIFYSVPQFGIKQKKKLHGIKKIKHKIKKLFAKGAD